jgi:SAM-dependent methyltransferase
MDQRRTNHGAPDPDQHARRASSFGSQAAAYAEFRPDYPVALLEWGLAAVRDAPNLRVLDIGAGTGKLTAGLHALGVRVVAVEPDPAMLAELRATLPDVAALPGTAESIPLADASVDAVFVGQALHWFDLDRALPEIGRVLRPGGSLVAAWNTYDDRVPWVARMCSVTDAVSRSVHIRAPKPPLDDFGAVDEAEFPHQARRTVDSMLSTVATQSSMIVSTPEERDQKLAQLREFLLADPATAHGEFTVPIMTQGVRVTPG